MPIVQSLQRYDKRQKKRLKEYDFQSLFTQLTEKILKDMPDLVLEVSQGRADAAALTQQIHHLIDTNTELYPLAADHTIKRVMNFMFGYGELQPYIEDEDITDIDGTRYDEFVIKKHGKREKINVNFGSEQIFDTYVKLIAIRNHGILNENDCHCRVTDMKNRLRINLCVRPRSITGPTINIRKHRQSAYDLDALCNLRMFDEQIKQTLKAYARSDKSVLFCGKGAAGKTTLLRAFINAMPDMERVMIAESDAEIFPKKPYVIQHRIKKSNEGGIKITLQDLMRDGLTMSLDTYCIGEITGVEAWDFIKASFSGHRCTGTIHAENASAVFARLMVLAGSDALSTNADTFMQMAAKGIDVVIYLRDFGVYEMIEVKEYDIRTKRLVTKTIFSKACEEYNTKG